MLCIITASTTMKKYLALLIALLYFQSAFAQVDFARRFIKRMYFDKDSSKKANLILVPALASSPETGLEVGGAALYSFYTDSVMHSVTRVSDLYGYAAITTKGQEKISINANYWTPQNKWHYLATASFYNYPFDFYGLGNNTLKANDEVIDEKLTRLLFTANTLIAPNLYAGFVAGGFKYYYYAGTYNQNIEFKTDPAIQGRYGGSSVYIGPSAVFDTRNSSTYTTSGVYINTYYNMMQGVFANNGYIGGLFDLDYAEFFKLDRKLVLGLNVKEQSLTGGQSPFYLLPQLGNDALMRGYYTGRYRDRNLLAGQTELRYRITDRFGIVGFAGTGEVASGMFTADALKPDYGGGFRYFFDTEKGLSIRVDYGIGEKVAGESRQQGLYIALGESF
jgi:hypothetical protein